MKVLLVPERDSNNSRPQDEIEWEIPDSGESMSITVDGRRLQFRGEDMIDLLEALKRRRSA
jgi:hypothetical protein